MNPGVPEGLAVPALLMTPVVLLLICTIYINTTMKWFSSTQQ